MLYCTCFFMPMTAFAIFSQSFLLFRTCVVVLVTYSQRAMTGHLICSYAIDVIWSHSWAHSGVRNCCDNKLHAVCNNCTNVCLYSPPSPMVSDVGDCSAIFILCNLHVVDRNSIISSTLSKLSNFPPISSLVAPPLPSVLIVFSSFLSSGVSNTLSALSILIALSTLVFSALCIPINDTLTFVYYLSQRATSFINAAPSHNDSPSPLSQMIVSNLAFMSSCSRIIVSTASLIINSFSVDVLGVELPISTIKKP